MKLSDMIEQLIWIRGERINLRDYALFRPFYDSAAARTLLKSGRQVGKSTAIACKQVAKACIREFKRILTVLPLANQTHRFSKLYVDPLIRYSPLLKDRISRDLQYNIGLKVLKNGSELHFNYAGDNPDRVRGISVQEINWDEIQDINHENIPVVEQCAGHEKDPRFSYCGTPKTKSNTMESLWLLSSQGEPFIVCSRCNFANYCMIPDVYHMIRPQGLSCQKCGGVLSMEDVYNVRYDYFNKKKIGIFDGHHIPQIYVPYNLKGKRWKKIIQDYGEYSPFMFATEVLGISYDVGGNPITMAHLKKCCNPERKLKSNVDFSKYAVIIGGIDWGISAVNSLTVLSILGVRPDGKIDLLFAKKFTYADPEEQVRVITNYLQQYNCQAVGVDHGAGYAQNMKLRYNLGIDKIYEYQYGVPQKILKFLQEQSRYVINKVQTLDLLFNDIRKERIVFPHYDDMDVFFRDIMSITEEFKSSPGGDKRYYVKNPGIADDFTHSLNFALITARLLTRGSIIGNILEE